MQLDDGSLTNYLLRLRAQGLQIPQDMETEGPDALPQNMLARLQQDAQEPTYQPTALSRAVPGQGFQGLESGQGVVQAGNGPVIRINSAPSQPQDQTMMADVTRPIEIAGRGKGYYSKDGTSAIINGQKVLLGYDREKTQANQDRAMKLQKFESDQAYSKAQMDKIDAETALLNQKPAASGAVTMTEIVDPSDPTRMLRVDARTYQGGTLGEAGVLGVSGKEPSAAKREETMSHGKDLLKNEIDALRSNYNLLNDKRAIPSTSRDTLSNMGSYIQASGVGQMLGRAGGTQEQSARDQINSARLRLINGIRAATGMSSKSIDSNQELKTWLDSLTNPQNSYETNSAILDSIESTFLGGGKPKGNDVNADLPPKKAGNLDGFNTMGYSKEDIEHTAKLRGISPEEVIRQAKARGVK